MIADLHVFHKDVHPYPDPDSRTSSLEEERTDEGKAVDAKINFY